MQIESIHIAWIIAVGAVLFVAGGLLGYFLARYRWEDRLDDLEKRETSLRQRRVELQRAEYQESTARIRQLSDAKDKSDSTLREVQKQRDLEYAILEQEALFEQSILKEENESLKEDIRILKGEPVEYHDLDEPTLFEDVLEVEEGRVDFDEVEVVEEDAEHEEPVSVEEDAEHEEPVSVEDAAEHKEPVSVEEAAALQEPAEPAAAEEKHEPSPIPEEVPDPLVDNVLEENDEESDAKAPFEVFEFHWTPSPEPIPAAAKAEPQKPGKKQEAPPKPDVGEAAHEDAGPDPEKDIEPVVEKTVETAEDQDAIPEVDKVPDHDDDAPLPPAPATNSELPEFQLVASFVPPDVSEVHDSIRTIVGLSADQFELLSDLGYASAEKLSGLTPAEISRLSEIFRIPVETIEGAWKPAAASLLS